MKSSLSFAVLSLFLLSPLSALAVESPFGPGTKYNPIYIEDVSKPKIVPGADYPRTDYWLPWGNQPQQLQPQQNNSNQLNNYLLQQQLLNQLSRSQPQLTLDQQCKNTYGVNAYAANGTCYYCPAGYHWTADMKCAPAVDNNVTITLSSPPVSESSGSGGISSSGGTIYISPPAPKNDQSQTSREVVENNEPTEMEKLTNWEKHYGKGEVAGANTAASSTSVQTAIGLFGMFGILLLFGGVLRVIT